MTELHLHGEPVGTVFDLLGHRENDMTFALGWGLARSAGMLSALLAGIAPDAPFLLPAIVELQQHDSGDRGYTDIEILTQNVHVIVEAKRGWAHHLPASFVGTKSASLQEGCRNGES